MHAFNVLLQRKTKKEGKKKHDQSIKGKKKKAEKKRIFFVVCKILLFKQIRRREFHSIDRMWHIYIGNGGRKR